MGERATRSRCMRGASFRRRERTDQGLELPLLSEAPQRVDSPDFLATAGAGHGQGAAACGSVPFKGNKKSLTEGGMDSHDGIQKLLAAEQEAQAIVAAARQGE